LGAKVDFVKDVSADLEARLAKIDAAVGELLDSWREHAEGRDRLGRELVEERARNLEIQRKILPMEQALASAQERLVELERALAVTSYRADEAEQGLASARDRADEAEQNLASVRDRADEAEQGLASVRDRAEEAEQGLASVRDRANEAERDLASARDRIKELEAALALATDRAAQANRAQTRIAALEAQLADVSGDLAEREHLAEELQQALRYERDLRKLREAERDRLRELFGYLQKSRWRRFGQAIGIVKTREWERISDE
jgi:chromosome segregation ATPase